MKKLLCVLLTLALLLPVLAGCEAIAEKKIEKLLACQFKSLVGIATRDELRSTRTEAYWESREGTPGDFEKLAENGGRQAAVATTEGELIGDFREALAEEYGENIEVTAEVTEMEKVDIKDYHEDKFKRAYPYLELKDVDAAYSVKYIITIKGSKKTLELQEASNPMIIKVDGQWYLQ